jgi:hypothetical protein
MPRKLTRSRASVLALATRAAKPTRAKPRHLEAQEQRLFVQRFRLDPRTRDLPACAIPNGGKRGAREAALMKAEGVSAGAPDWVLFVPAYGFYNGGNIVSCGLCLEFKSPDGKGRTNPAQRDWHERLVNNHYQVAVVNTAEAAWLQLCDYLRIVP